jgi:hypothetical protein
MSRLPVAGDAGNKGYGDADLGAVSDRYVSKTGDGTLPKWLGAARKI